MADRTTDGISFDTLRGANVARLPQFKNKHGGRAHSEPDGSDWSPAQWLQAVIGELGEFANKRKKYERGDIDFDEYAREARSELADVMIYFDILCLRALDGPDITVQNSIDHLRRQQRVIDSKGINLGEAVMEKFNEVSERVGSNVFVEADDWHRRGKPRPFTPPPFTDGEQP